MSKTKVGTVLALFISRKDNPNRVPKTSITLDAQGILDNKFYNKNIKRSVLIATKDSYDLALQNDINIDYGLLGENILIDYNPYSMLPGQKLQIGTTILEISQNCTLCKGLSQVDAKLPKLLKEDRGIFSKVDVSGTIKLDDEVYILNNLVST